MGKATSPAPIFQTDDDREYFMVTLKINPRAKKMAAEISPKRATENQRQILEAIGKNPHITAPELTGILGISERKTKENIKKLKGKTLLKRMGPDKGGYWEVIR